MTVPETVVLPITPYPNVAFRPGLQDQSCAPSASARVITLPERLAAHKSAAALRAVSCVTPSFCPRHRDIFVSGCGMSTASDIGRIIDTAREEMIFIGPDHP